MLEIGAPGSLLQGYYMRMNGLQTALQSVWGNFQSPFSSHFARLALTVKNLDAVFAPGYCRVTRSIFRLQSRAWQLCGFTELFTGKNKEKR